MSDTATWADQVRVRAVEVRTPLTRRLLRVEWVVEMLYRSGQWQSPYQAAVLGPDSLTDAIDAASQRFADEAAATAAACALVTALDSDVRVTIHP